MIVANISFYVYAFNFRREKVMIRETLSGISTLNNLSAPFCFVAEGNYIVGRYDFTEVILWDVKMS